MCPCYKGQRRTHRSWASPLPCGSRFLWLGSRHLYPLNQLSYWPSPSETLGDFWSPFSLELSLYLVLKMRFLVLALIRLCRNPRAHKSTQRPPTHHSHSPHSSWVIWNSIQFVYSLKLYWTYCYVASFCHLVSVWSRSTVNKTQAVGSQGLMARRWEKVEHPRDQGRVTRPVSHSLWD